MTTFLNAVRSREVDPMHFSNFTHHEKKYQTVETNWWPLDWGHHRIWRAIGWGDYNICGGPLDWGHHHRIWKAIGWGDYNIIVGDP